MIILYVYLAGLTGCLIGTILFAFSEYRQATWTILGLSIIWPIPLSIAVYRIGFYYIADQNAIDYKDKG